MEKKGGKMDEKTGAGIRRFPVYLDSKLISTWRTFQSAVMMKRLSLRATFVTVRQDYMDRSKA